MVISIAIARQNIMALFVHRTSILYVSKLKQLTVAPLTCTITTTIRYRLETYCKGAVHKKRHNILLEISGDKLLLEHIVTILKFTIFTASITAST